MNLRDNQQLDAAIHESICLVPHDISWPSKFNEERSRLLGIFSKDIIEIEHIGSTAVAGMSAKPIIDLIASVLSMKAADYLLGPLREFGYFTPTGCNSNLTERRWLMRSSNGHRTHHLHLVRSGSEGWKRTIKFRDILRNNSDVAASYEDLKKQLAKADCFDRDIYAKGKTSFIEEILKMKC